MQKTWIYGLAGASLLLGACAQTPKYSPIVVTEPMPTLETKLETCGTAALTPQTAVKWGACYSQQLQQYAETAQMPLGAVKKHTADVQLFAAQYAAKKLTKAEFEAHIAQSQAALLAPSTSPASQPVIMYQPAPQMTRGQAAWVAAMQEYANTQREADAQRQKAAEDYARATRQNQPRTTTCDPNGLGGMRCTTY